MIDIEAEKEYITLLQRHVSITLYRHKLDLAVSITEGKVPSSTQLDTAICALRDLLVTVVALKLVDRLHTAQRRK